MALPHPIDSEFDLPPHEAPAHTYIIASTPRAGGTYLSKMLWETGILGCPTEYFNIDRNLFRLTARLGVETPDELLQRIMRVRTTPNGVFGVKAHFNHLQFLGISGLLRKMGPLKFVRMTRNEPIAEAVSLSRALQTGQWTSQTPTERTPAVYYTKHINWCVRHLDVQKRGWDHFFESRKVPHITIAYETFIANPSAIVDGVVRALGYPTTPKITINLPEMTKQSNALNQEWIERYKNDPDRIRP